MAPRLQLLLAAMADDGAQSDNGGLVQEKCSGVVLEVPEFHGERRAGRGASDLAIGEFAKHSNGLLSNFALLGIAALREGAGMPGHWQWVQQQAGFRAKKTADRPSYAWDQLIELFVEHVIAGTTEGIGGAEVDVSNAEQALRLMAQEDRINRRMLGEAFLESIQIVISRRATRFARRVIAGPTAINRTLGYIILILAQPRRGTAWGLRPIPPGPCADPASLLLRVDGGGAGAGERGRSCARCASLKSGISLPINHISSTLQPASRSSFRLEVS